MSRLRFPTLIGISFLVIPFCISLCFASEGMWTLDNLPRKDLQQRYGFSPDAAWTRQAMQASVRLAGGCSGSFVSTDGLVLTNHHCVVSCVQDLSTAANNLVNDGFLAKDRPHELQCPGMEVNQLDSITDVTQRVREKSHGLTGKSFNEAHERPILPHRKRVHSGWRYEHSLRHRSTLSGRTVSPVSIQALSGHPSGVCTGV